MNLNLPTPPGLGPARKWGSNASIFQRELSLCIHHIYLQGYASSIRKLGFGLSDSLENHLMRKGKDSDSVHSVCCSQSLSHF